MVLTALNQTRTSTGSIKITLGTARNNTGDVIEAPSQLDVWLALQRAGLPMTIQNGQIGNIRPVPQAEAQRLIDEIKDQFPVKTNEFQPFQDVFTGNIIPIDNDKITPIETRSAGIIRAQQNFSNVVGTLNPFTKTATISPGIDPNQKITDFFNKPDLFVQTTRATANKEGTLTFFNGKGTPTTISTNLHTNNNFNDSGIGILLLLGLTAVAFS